MSRFRKLTHAIWHCQYHIVWVPKYRYRVLNGKIGDEVRKNVIIQCERLGCSIVELNIQNDHCHLFQELRPYTTFLALVVSQIRIMACGVDLQRHRLRQLLLRVHQYRQQLDMKMCSFCFLSYPFVSIRYILSFNIGFTLDSSL